MLIRQLIRNYFKNGPNIWDLNYSKVSVDRLKVEFQSIRYYFLSNYEQGSMVAIALKRDYRYFLVLLACMDIGIVFVPLRVEWPKARIKQIQKISGFIALLDDRLIEKIINNNNSTNFKDDELAPISSDQTLYCLFTSGTTGSPKGVLIKRSAYENFLKWSGNFFKDIKKYDKILNSTDYTFDVALAEVALTLTKHLNFYCSNFSDNFFVFLNELNNLKINIIATVPNNMTLLLDERLLSKADLSNLKHALIAGSRFPLALKKSFEKNLSKTRVYNCYGPTEATIYCIARELNGLESSYLEEGTVSVGTAIPGCLPLIVDENFNPVDIMQKGELLIGGNQIMDCYSNNLAATKSAIVKINSRNYYRTGDIAFRNKNGDFFITGRNDDTIKISGQRVNLSDIDSYVQQLDFIHSCACIGIEHSIRGSEMILYLVTKENLAKEDIFLALKELLPNHQIPQDIVIMKKLPINNSGKICKKTLKEMFLKTFNGL